ncbi:MAG: DUF4153 domain-containing protein [Methylophilaceae bacterium]
MAFNMSKIFNPVFWVQIYQVVLQTVKRFPLACLCLLALAFLLISETHNFNPFSRVTSTRVALLSLGGSCWFVAMALFVESKQRSSLKHYVVAGLGFAFYSWHVFGRENLGMASVGIAIAAALAITFSPWLRRQQNNDSFWYFNFQLISTIFFAWLSTLLLSGGLSLILLSLGYLFDLNIHQNFYADIWTIGGVLFGGLYFLANIPSQFDYDKVDCSQFPKGIQFIQTYVLVPLSLVYMAILYAYFAKIIFQWALPHGHLGMMVSTFGLIGVVTHLTIYPVHDRTGLLGWFYRHFYLAMVLPLGLFVLAVGVRINQYGLTEKRYILVLVAIWFAILIAARLIRRQQFSLRTVTLSFAVLCFVASLGPWSINKLPLNNQISRLERVLTKHNLLTNGRYTTPKQPLSFETKKSVSSMVDYVVDHHGIDRLRPWFSDKKALKKALDCDKEHEYSCGSNGRRLLSHMGIDYINRWQKKNSNHKNIRLTYSSEPIVIPLNGYDYFVPISLYQNNKTTALATPLDQAFELSSVALNDAQLQLVFRDKKQVNIDFVDFMRQFSAHGNIEVPVHEVDKMTLSYEQDGVDIQLYIKNINQAMVDGKAKITHLEANLLLKKSQP